MLQAIKALIVGVPVVVDPGAGTVSSLPRIVDEAKFSAMAATEERISFLSISPSGSSNVAVQMAFFSVRPERKSESLLREMHCFIKAKLDEYTT